MSNPSEVNDINSGSNFSPLNNYTNISQNHDRIHTFHNDTTQNINEIDQNDTNCSQNHDRCTVNEQNNTSYIRHINKQNN